MDFKKISLEDLPFLRDMLRDYCGRICDISPANIVFWRDYYDTSLSAGEDGFAIRFGNMDDGVFYYASESRKIIEDIINAEGGSANFTCLCEDEVKFFKDNFDCSEPYHHRDWDDYIYSSADISSLKGKRYNGQRNHINKFFKTYADVEFRDIKSSDTQALGDFIRRYFEEKSAIAYDDSFDYEEAHLFEQLQNLEIYAQRTGVLLVDGKIAGFSIGELVGKTLIIHTEKADISYDGVYAALVNLFAKKHGADAEFINREEDCGIEGLRRSKLSYHPLEIRPKYALTAKIK